MTLKKPARGSAAAERRKRVAAKLRAWLALCKVVDARDGRRCRVCGAGGEIHRHHIVKRSQGGPDALENVITLCPQCHTDTHNARLTITGTASALCVVFNGKNGPGGKYYGTSLVFKPRHGRCAVDGGVHVEGPFCKAFRPQRGLGE